MIRRLLALLTLAVFVGCASDDVVELAAQEAVIPCFAAGDPRVETAGFVGETLRLHQNLGDTRYTLMAFVVGDTLTLGAMVRGGFAGTVVWEIGDREIAFPFDTSKSLKDVSATSSGLIGQGASFRGTSWINYELAPRSEWLEDGTPIRLTFESGSETAVLPAAGRSYIVRLESR